VALLTRYRRLAQGIGPLYLPLLALQLVALGGSILPGLVAGPLQGVVSALVPLGIDPLVTGMSLALVHQARRGQSLAGREAWGQAVRIWPRLVATSALTVLAAVAPTGWLFYLAYHAFEQAFLGGGNFILPFVGMILAALPGIYLGVRLFYTVPLLFTEPQPPLSALKRSWQLTRGRWWQTATAFLPLGGLVLLVGLLLGWLLSGLSIPGLAYPQWVLALRLVGPLGWTFYLVLAEDP